MKIHLKSLKSLKTSLESMMFGLIAQADFGGGIKPNTQNEIFAPAAGFEANSQLPLGYATRAISIIVTLLTTFAGLMFLFQFFMGAMNWISAGGDQKKIQEARDRITQGVIGLVVIVVAYSVVGVISTILGIEILNPGPFLLRLFAIPIG